MSEPGFEVFALNSSREWGSKVAESLDLELAEHEERDFEDGEHKVRPLVNVRERDVFVIQSLFSEPGQSVNDKVCRLLFFIGALKDASAKRVTAVIPYFAYARKDRKTKSRDPVTMRYIARLLEAAGADHVLAFDIHNLAAFQNAFRVPTDHLEARALFAPYFAGLLKEEDVVVVSPDAGGAKRAEKFRESLSELLQKDIASAFMEKKRSSGVVSGELVIGDVQGRTAIIIDDIISSGTTMKRAVGALQRQGAAKIYAAAAHGIFIGAAADLISDSRLEKVVITNSMPPLRLEQRLIGDRMDVLDAAPMFAEAIKRIHNGGSIVELMGGAAT